MMVKLIVLFPIYVCLILTNIMPLHGHGSEEKPQAAGVPILLQQPLAADALSPNIAELEHPAEAPTADVLAPHMAAPQPPEEAPAVVVPAPQIARLEAEAVRNIYAFHATYRLPQDGKLIAGKANNGKLIPKDKGKPLNGIAGWRPTVHFSLGGICPDSAENILSTRNHIIIVRLKDLEHQLIGLYPFDSIILGDYIIPPTATLIVPVEEVEKTKALPWVVGTQIDVKGRDSSISLTKQVLMFLLKEKEEWRFSEEKSAAEEKNEGKENPRTHIVGKHLRHPNQEVTKNFFRNFLEEAPWVTYGPHAQHPLGFIDINSHYLLWPKLGRNQQLVPGGSQVKNLIQEVFEKYKQHIIGNKSELEPYLTNKFQELTGMALRHKQNDNIFKLYFERDDVALSTYAVSWITKGNFHLGKIAPIIIEDDKGKHKYSKEQVEAHLKEIGMDFERLLNQPE